MTLRRESGQATTGILLVVTLILLSLGLTYHVRVSKAVDQAGGLKSATDAAALAGAQSIQDLTWGEIMSAIHAGKELRHDLGQTAASEFAGRNGGRLIDYVYDPLTARVKVTVESQKPLESGQIERRTSTADVGTRIARCLPQAGFSWQVLVGITNLKLPIKCGELEFDVEADGTTQTFKHVLNQGQFKKLFKDRHIARLIEGEATAITEGRPDGNFNPPAGPAGPVYSGDWYARGMSWVNENIGYSQSAWHTNQYGRYRTDCSGYVSLMWGLGDSLTTWTLPSVSHRITKDELQPGDIMDSIDGQHTLLFAGWTDASKTEYWTFEESPYVGGAAYHKVPYPYWPSSAGTYLPYRKNA